MYIVESRDGTKIACRNIGQGSPVLLVHGTSADASRWDPIVDMLSYHFNVYLMDRRGRGASGDTLPYEPAREFEDVAAVIEAIGRPTAVVGHSFGGLCALEAARLTPHVRKLVLYEPTTRPAGMNSLYPSGSIERLEARLAVDDRAGLVESFMQEVVRASPEDIAVMRAQRAWPQRLAAAHTIPRELRAHRDYIFLPERFAEIRVPALILLGAESPTRFRVQSEAAAAALPYSRLLELPGQRHAAVDTAPGLFVRELVEFLRDTF